MRNAYFITVNNPDKTSFNINITRPVYFAFANSKEEAVGKMMLSSWGYKHLPILKILCNDCNNDQYTDYEVFAIEVRWQGLSGDQAFIGKFKVNNSVLNELEETFAGQISINVLENVCNFDTNTLDEVIHQMKNTDYGKI
jgi:hypothetical protein